MLSAGQSTVAMTSPGQPCSCIWISCIDSRRDQGCAAATGPLPAAGGVCCGDACIFTGFDPQNCGACGSTCGDAELCVPESVWLYVYTGECLSAPACDAEHNTFACRLDAGVGICCLGQCVDPGATPCGSCGQACPDGGLCSPPSCDPGCGDPCPAGTVCDPRSNPSFCSPTSCAGLADGLACARPSEPSYERECCGGACIDPFFDSSNCGACGFQCPADSECRYGRCASRVDCSSAANRTECTLDGDEGECCGGSCVSFDDPANCGGCNLTCPVDDECRYGICVDSMGQIAQQIPGGCDGGDTGDLCALDDAGNEGSCCDGQCLYGLCTETICGADSDGTTCQFGSLPGICCSQRCVDPNQDPSNCFECGVRCSSGICANWVGCVPALLDSDCPSGCPADSVCARGKCVDSLCDDPYDGPLAGELLVYQIRPSYPDVSTPTFCAAADGNVGVCGPEGQCVDLVNDARHCGGFFNACPAGQTCAHGVCSGTPPECGLGRIGAFCNLDAGQSFLCCPGVGCTDTNGDVANCGDCNVVCAPDQACIAGTCQ
jgi:hypothetical protein